MLWLFYGRLNYYVNNIPIVQKIRLSPMLKTPLHAVLLLMIAMLCVQGSGSLAKILFQSFPVLTVSAMRLFFGAMILAIIFRIWKINFKHVRWKAILSYGVALAGMNGLFYLSLERLPLGIAVAFEFIGPLSVALYHAKQRFDFIWVGFAILGLILLFPMQQAQQGQAPNQPMAAGGRAGYLFGDRVEQQTDFIEGPQGGNEFQETVVEGQEQPSQEQLEALAMEIFQLPLEELDEQQLLVVYQEAMQGQPMEEAVQEEDVQFAAQGGLAGLL